MYVLLNNLAPITLQHALLPHYNMDKDAQKAIHRHKVNRTGQYKQRVPDGPQEMREHILLQPD